jgi:uncharacterized membrane protein (DUF4010 family)
VDDLPAEVLGLSVALGAGLLIGLDRERRKGSGPGREPAGIRSFTLAALGGALAQALDLPWLVVLGAAMVALLAAMAYWRSPPCDPGLTTELALFVTYLIGVLAMQQPAFGAGAAAAVALLLAARDRLHRFATAALSDAELHDALVLAALVLVVLPLTPAEPLPWLAGLVPRTLVLLVVLILALQGAGHLAGRWLGPRAGPALAGLFSGFVSSTATVASMGVKARAQPTQAAAWEAGAMLSTAATWLQALVMLLAVTPTLAIQLAPGALAGALAAAATGLWRARAAPRVAADDADRQHHGPLRLRAAVLLSAMLVAVSLAVRWAQRGFGNEGVLASAALAALADAHAAVISLAALHAGQGIGDALALTGILLAVGSNSLTRSITAAVAGGGRYALRIAGSLALSGAAALAALWASGVLALS